MIIGGHPMDGWMSDNDELELDRGAHTHNKHLYATVNPVFILKIDFAVHSATGT
jgi:hypothetical protein